MGDHATRMVYAEYDRAVKLVLEAMTAADPAAESSVERLVAALGIIIICQGNEIQNRIGELKAVSRPRD